MGSTFPSSKSSKVNAQSSFILFGLTGSTVPKLITVSSPSNSQTITALVPQGQASDQISQYLPGSIGN